MMIILDGGNMGEIWEKWVGNSLEELGERKKITNAKRKVKGIWRF